VPQARSTTLHPGCGATRSTKRRFTSRKKGSWLKALKE